MFKKRKNAKYLTSYNFELPYDISERIVISILHTFKEAPPTRKPSMSSCFASSALLPPFTDPEMRLVQIDH